MLLQRSAEVVSNPKLHLVLRLPTRPLYPSYCPIQVHFELCEFRVVRFTQSELSCGWQTDHLCRRGEQTSISSACVSLRETCSSAKAPMLNPDFGRQVVSGLCVSVGEDNFASYGALSVTATKFPTPSSKS